MRMDANEIKDFTIFSADTPTKKFMELRNGPRIGKNIFNEGERKYLFEIFKEEIENGAVNISASVIREKLGTLVVRFYSQEFNLAEGITINRIRSTLKSRIISANNKKRKMLKQMSMQSR